MGTEVARHAIPPTPRPQLDLSGKRLRAAFESVATGCEPMGGIERYVEALKLKARMFQDALLGRDVRDVDANIFAGLCTFMSTVRRRVSPYLTADGLERLRPAVAVLLAHESSGGSTDECLAAFETHFPGDREHRWTRDFAAEVLHNLAPERFPNMSRWVWDARANTGVLREIWFGDDVDRITIGVADDFATFLTLREELAVFMSDNGIFRDVLYYVGLLQAQVYAEYICAQGGTYLRADFSSPEDPMQHTRRMLGLDGVKTGSTKTRLRCVDGSAFLLSEEGI